MDRNSRGCLMPLVTRQQYRELERTEITAGSTAIAGLLGEADLGVFAQYSSWAIYPDVSVQPQASAQDPSAVNSYSAVEGIAHNDVVLVAYNLGRPKNPVHGARVGDSHHGKDRLWENFHSGIRDFNIARGTQGNAFRGAYITDFFKGMPTKSIDEFNRELRCRRKEWAEQYEDEMQAILDYELSLLGAQNAPLVAFGGKVAEVLLKRYGPHRVHHVQHYADAVGRYYHRQFESLGQRLSLTCPTRA